MWVTKSDKEWTTFEIFGSCISAFRVMRHRSQSLRLLAAYEFLAMCEPRMDSWPFEIYEHICYFLIEIWLFLNWNFGSWISSIRVMRHRSQSLRLLAAYEFWNLWTHLKCHVDKLNSLYELYYLRFCLAQVIVEKDGINLILPHGDICNFCVWLYILFTRHKGNSTYTYI